MRQYAPDNIGVVSVQPVREFVVARRESLGSGFGAIGGYGRQVGLEICDGNGIVVPALVIDVAIGVNVGTEESLECCVAESVGRKVICNGRVDRNQSWPVRPTETGHHQDDAKSYIQ